MVFITKWHWFISWARQTTNRLFTSCVYNSMPLVLVYLIPNYTPLVLVISLINVQQITYLLYSQQHVTGSYTKPDKSPADRRFTLFIPTR